jgi:hypothetical protein
VAQKKVSDDFLLVLTVSHTVLKRLELLAEHSGASVPEIIVGILAHSKNMLPSSLDREATSFDEHQISVQISSRLAKQYTKLAERFSVSRSKLAGLVLTSVLTDINPDLKVITAPNLTQGLRNTLLLLANIGLNKDLNTDFVPSVEMLVDPGTASIQEISRLFGELSVLYRMCGGSGLNFNITDVRELEMVLT